MLGKTNCTAIEKGTIVDDVVDYSWDAIKVNGVNSNFIKTISEGNILAGITADGTIVYTKDGENWETKKITLDNGDDYELTDIAYVLEKYVIVGSHANTNYIHGLVITTEDFQDYEVMQDWVLGNNNIRLLAVSQINSKAVIYAVEYANLSYNLHGASVKAIRTDVTYKADSDIINICDFYNVDIKKYFCKIASTTSGTCIIYIRDAQERGRKFVSKDSITFNTLTDGSSKIGVDEYNVFECKDSLYFIANISEDNYKLRKIINETENAVMTIDINFGFIDAVYFNKSEIFINTHELLIVRPNESISDKALDDLVEITYDFSMTSIEKAFDKLYIFGTGGNVLVSSDEIHNEESLAVKTMSASKALYDAKAYTDLKYAELEDRIAALEALTEE